MCATGRQLSVGPNVIAGEIKELPPLIQARWNFSAVAVDGAIFAIGGRGASEFEEKHIILNSVERFSLLTKQWTMMAPMKKHRYGHRAITSYQGKIFVFGGLKFQNDRYPRVSDVETYDPDLDLWMVDGDFKLPDFDYHLIRM